MGRSNADSESVSVYSDDSSFCVLRQSPSIANESNKQLPMITIPSACDIISACGAGFQVIGIRGSLIKPNNEKHYGFNAVKGLCMSICQQENLRMRE